ncbi:MAG: FlgD immunoglobulin-like domain containing protein [bacterium]
MRALAALAFVLVGLAAGQSYLLKSATLCGGRLWLRGGEYEAGLTVGQQTATGELEAGPFRATLGFWHGQDQVGVSEEGQPSTPSRLAFGLGPSSPNPFNRRTAVSFSLPIEADVSLRVYNSAGRVVTTLVQGRHKAGRYNVTWDVGGVSSAVLPNGTYFCRLEAGGQTAVRKLVKTD